MRMEPSVVQMTGLSNLSIDIWSEGTYTAGRRKYLNAKTAKDARWQSNIKRPRRTKESH
jgi:hypothetical protein